MNRDKAVSNRLAALQSGNKRYVGEACMVTLDHVADSASIRYSSSGRCCDCDKQRVYDFRAARRESAALQKTNA